MLCQSHGCANQTNAMTVLVVVAVMLSTVVDAAAGGGRTKEKIIIHESAASLAPNARHTGGQQPGGFGSASSDYARNFRGGTSSTTTPTTNSKACPARSVLRVDFTPSPDGDGRLYGNIFGSGVLLASAQDYFEYEIMWKDEKCNCGAEFEVGTQFRHRDNGKPDDLGYSPHSERNANMSAVAFGKWYKRRWSLVDVEGKYIDKFVLSAYSAPGVTVTAFFKYIRIVRGEEKRRVVFESGGGSEPPNVTPYFPGTIVNSCQHEITLDGSDLQFIGGAPAPATSQQHMNDGDTIVVKHNEKLVIRGLIDSRSLSDLGKATSSDSSLSNVNDRAQCPYFIPVMEEFRWLAANRDPRVRLSAIDVRVRMGAPFPNVRLFHVASWNETRWVELKPLSAGGSQPSTSASGEVVLVPRQTSPWLLHAEFVVPGASQLTHLLDGSWIDVATEYHLVLDGWVSPMIRTVVKSYRLALFK
ncbi:membrane-associated protein, putative [Bodo saltans]|uniref:Membrane-associated protein, putative n=1 Tax=Bodo saltans TaxID=75058 RepID=A0A0S4J8C4_BODSA|nr:membrane-associated protein, putative [Bodo saltans]|eukprot:CUG85632.1 membrane-associated protein, putative [Bodo saltans]